MSAAILCSPALASMLQEIEVAVAGVDEGRPARVAAALQPYLHQPDLLASVACRSCPNGYIRHLLQANAAAHYAVVALVWRPGQMSPVHAHRTWCALGVHRGVLTEAHYALLPGSPQPRQSGSALRPCGATSHGPADPAQIHRLANLSLEEAVSIHVYGADFDRFGQDVNHVY